MSRRLVALTEAHRERSWATPRYLRRLVAERRIPFHKIAGRVWFDDVDLAAHEEAARCEPPSRWSAAQRRPRSGRPAGRGPAPVDDTGAGLALSRSARRIHDTAPP